MKIFYRGKTCFDAIRRGIPFGEANLECLHGHRFCFDFVANERSKINTALKNCSKLKLMEQLPYANDLDLILNFKEGLEWLNLDSAIDLKYSSFNELVFASYKTVIGAAHFLPKVPKGHKCANLHGHNFIIEVFLDSFDYQKQQEIRHYLKGSFEDKLLNDIEGLSNPTSENLAVYILKQLEAKDYNLAAVKVSETQNSGCIAFKDSNKLQCFRRFSFDSAIGLNNFITGRTFDISINLLLPLDQELGWTIDYGDIKRLVKPYLKEVDHQDLRQINLDPKYSQFENIALKLSHSLKAAFLDSFAMLAISANEANQLLVLDKEYSLGNDLWLV